MMKDLKELVRPNIWALEPYSCARDEFKGRKAEVFLDANESPFNNPYNRYPDPLQEELKADISRLKGIPEPYIFLGNGSDEAIDLVYRVFCNPGVDNVVAMSPTYGMYAVCADINDIRYRSVPLDKTFNISAEALLKATNSKTKVIWLCTPNNPTGNSLDRKEVEKVIETFNGIVVVDEAYSDFSDKKPFRFDVSRYPNLIVLNTMSKAWASAGIRLGMAFANPNIIALFNKVKYPYNVNILTLQQARKTLADYQRYERWLVSIRTEREHVLPAIADLPICLKLYPTDSNFFLMKVPDADRIYNYLIDQGIVVRNRNRVQLCGNCLRITIGTTSENNTLLGALRKYKA